jgi:hypothetical protein
MREKEMCVRECEKERTTASCGDAMCNSIVGM